MQLFRRHHVARSAVASSTKSTATVIHSPLEEVGYEPAHGLDQAHLVCVIPPRESILVLYGDPEHIA
jgi:hypothetical protein